MPTIPQAVIAMLACARIGAVHSVVFGGFAPAELAARIDDAEPKVVVCASCGIEPARVVPYKPLLDGRWLSPRTRWRRRWSFSGLSSPASWGRDITWDDAVKGVPRRGRRGGRHRPALHPLHLGHHGKPKGVVRDNGGHAVALQWSVGNVFGIRPGQVFWAASDVGWVVGHSYIVYAPLLAGATTVLYEGKPVGTPDAGAFGRVIAENKVSALFTAPPPFGPSARRTQKGDS